MTDKMPTYGTSRSEFPSNAGPQMFQFSLFALFIIVTLPALILAVYFGVGRLAGMSTTEILTQGLGQLLFSVPVLLVWAVGMAMAIRRLKRNRLPARLAVIALGGLMLTTFVLHVAQMVLIHWANADGISSEAMSWSMGICGVVYTLSNTACWILVIVAIFVRRPPDEPDIGEGVPTGSPF